MVTVILGVVAAVAFVVVVSLPRFAPRLTALNRGLHFFSRDLDLHPDVTSRTRRRLLVFILICLPVPFLAFANVFAFYHPEKVAAGDRVVMGLAFGASCTVALFMPSVITAFILQANGLRQ